MKAFSAIAGTCGLARGVRVLLQPMKAVTKLSPLSLFLRREPGNEAVREIVRHTLVLKSSLLVSMAENVSFTDAGQAR